MKRLSGRYRTRSLKKNSPTFRPSLHGLWFPAATTNPRRVTGLLWHLLVHGHNGRSIGSSFAIDSSFESCSRSLASSIRQHMAVRVARPPRYHSRVHYLHFLKELSSTNYKVPTESRVHRFDNRLSRHHRPIALHSRPNSAVGHAGVFVYRDHPRSFLNLAGPRECSLPAFSESCKGHCRSHLEVAVPPRPWRPSNPSPRLSRVWPLSYGPTLWQFRRTMRWISWIIAALNCASWGPG